LIDFCRETSATALSAGINSELPDFKLLMLPD